MGWSKLRLNVDATNTRGRNALVVIILIIALHSVLSLTHETYAHAVSSFLAPSSAASADPSDPPRILVDHAVPSTAVPESYFLPSVAGDDGVLAPSMRKNATLLMLARNSDLEMVVRSVRRLEDRFNRRHGYPWVFLNEVPFSEEFKARVSVLTGAEVHFGLIPPELWYQPDWIDEAKATAGRDKLEREGIIYGGSVAYRNMCRFNSGFFYRHELLQNYRWYWRVEPDVQFHCDINEDPFRYMEEHNKTYGFTVALEELRETVESLWETTMEFFEEHPQYIAERSSFRFLTDDNGQSYNLCHFWSNFEIADMDFWRGAAYSAYFDFLDRRGGFYYERWATPPVHSMAAALLLPAERVHFFSAIGYTHGGVMHCPAGARQWLDGKCDCAQRDSFDYEPFSCMPKWDRVNL